MFETEVSNLEALSLYLLVLKYYLLSLLENMEANDQRREQRRGHLVQENGELTLIGVGDVDLWTAWAYKPHTVSLLLTGACSLIWASGALDPEPAESGDAVTSVKSGVFGMIAVFLTHCLLQAPSTILIRLHPVIWWLVHGMAVVYLVALTFLLSQKRDDAQMFMKFLHSDLGVELPERSYSADCRLYTPEISQAGLRMFIGAYMRMVGQGYINS